VVVALSVLCACSSTLILRGGADQFLEESHRSVWDALNVVKRCIQNNEIVAGGGAIEMEVSKALREYARTIPGKEQLIINAYAKSLEIIPQQLCDNAGFDSTDVLNALRKKHHGPGGEHFGVDIDNDGICNTFEKVRGRCQNSPACVCIAPSVVSLRTDISSCLPRCSLCGSPLRQRSTRTRRRRRPQRRCFVWTRPCATRSRKVLHGEAAAAAALLQVAASVPPWVDAVCQV